MALTERIKLYKKIENERGNPLVVYVTSQRPGAVGGILSGIGELVNEKQKAWIKSKLKQDTVFCSS